MKDFRLKDGEVLRTVKCIKDTATVIEAGDLVALSAGVIIKAVAGSANIAYAPYGAPAGVTDIDVTIGTDFTLIGTGEQVFAVSQKGSEVDLIGTTTLLINNDASSTDVFKVGISKDAGTVDAEEEIEVRINKPLF